MNQGQAVTVSASVTRRNRAYPATGPCDRPCP